MSASKKFKWGLTDAQIKKDLTYNWTINNYSYLEKQKSCLYSPDFLINSEEDHVWYLRLSTKNAKNKNYLGLKLIWDCGGSCKNVFQGWCYISVLDHKGEKFLEDVKRIDKGFNEWDLPEFIKKDELRNKANGLLSNNCLIIHCEFISDAEVKNLSSEDNNEDEEPASSASKSEPSGIEKLFLDDRLSDVKLIASCGKSLPAHRNILAIFSPVFEAMFVNDMRERSEGEVKIDDSRYEALQEMLRFVYTGKVENFASNAADLIFLADKYQITELRKLCEKDLSKSMSADNVLDILTIAYQHDMEQLKNDAINFTKAYHREIVNSDAFKSLTNIQVLKTVTEAISEMNNSI